MIRTTYSLQGPQTLKLLTTNGGSFDQGLIEVRDVWVGEKNDYTWREVEYLKARDKKNSGMEKW